MTDSINLMTYIKYHINNYLVQKCRFVNSKTILSCRECEQYGGNKFNSDVKTNVDKYFQYDEITNMGKMKDYLTQIQDLFKNFFDVSSQIKNIPSLNDQVKLIKQIDESLSNKLTNYKILKHNNEKYLYEIKGIDSNKELLSDLVLLWNIFNNKNNKKNTFNDFGKDAIENIEILNKVNTIIDKYIDLLKSKPKINIEHHKYIITDSKSNDIQYKYGNQSGIVKLIPLDESQPRIITINLDDNGNNHINEWKDEKQFNEMKNYLDQLAKNKFAETIEIKGTSLPKINYGLLNMIEGKTPQKGGNNTDKLLELTDLISVTQRKIYEYKKQIDEIELDTTRASNYIIYLLKIATYNDGNNKRLDVYQYMDLDTITKLQTKIDEIYRLMNNDDSDISKYFNKYHYYTIIKLKDMTEILSNILKSSQNMMIDIINTTGPIINDFTLLDHFTIILNEYDRHRSS